MIKIENTEIVGWRAAIRGMRNPMNSWERSDSEFACAGCDDVVDIFDRTIKYGPIGDFGVTIGKNDHDLMMRLVKAGSVDAKFRRMIVVYADITAPLYWWKEFDTYKVGTVANSCSTMHRIHAKEFTLEDFSIEHLIDDSKNDHPYCSDLKFIYNYNDSINDTILLLNNAREWYLETNDKIYWWQMIQLLPSTYNQKRTVMLNYEVLSNIYRHRRNHKLDEWKELCSWIETMPYSEIITCGKNDTEENKDE